MKPVALEWIGTRTVAFERTREFFRGVLDLNVGAERPSFVRFDLPDGSSLEVFRPGGPDDHSYFTTGPVIGFQVEEFDSARSELERVGLALLGPVGGTPGEYRWQHFRGPDGSVYEIVDDPGRRSSDRKVPVGRCGVTGFGWVGVRTSRFDAMRRFALEQMRLTIEDEEDGLAEFRFPNGHVLELFRPGSEWDHPHLTTGPLPGLVVEDLERAESTLRAHGIEILQRRRFEEAGWSHFRAPDGCVYEIKRFSDDGPRS